MIIHEMPQRSDAWYAVRAGKFTASVFDDLMPSSRQKINEFNKTQMGIIYRLAAERTTGQPINGGFVSQAMQHGIDTEDEARIAFEFETGLEVKQVGFVEYDDWIGCSPDGLTELSGLEIKCPNSDTHLRYLREGFGEDYFYQVQGAMWISERETWNLVSFDPRFPEAQQLYREIKTPNEKAMVLRLRLHYAIEKAKEIMG
jgi:hypothetical protein